MHITKMHGLGNDFIVIVGRVDDASALARALCPRRLAVGADGLLLVEPSKRADVRMRIINADGSEAEMCGNGVRCFARYVYDRGIVKKEEMEIETLSGVVRPRLIVENGGVAAVRVDMGVPSFAAEDVPVLAENALGFEVCGVRAASVNFVELADRSTAYMRTWERGAGRTLACGTGATGCAALLYKKGLADSAVDMHVQAGVLHIELAEDGRAFMTGAAAYVFEGETL